MDEIPRRKAAEHWAGKELKKTDEFDEIDIRSVPYSTLVKIIETGGPARASRIVWAEKDVDWYKVTLNKESFLDLRVHKCYDDVGWGEIAPDRKLTTAVHRVMEEPDELNDDINIELVNKRKEQYIEGNNMDPLLLFKQEGEKNPWIVDGNHRSTGIALALRDGYEYEPIDAYLGISRISVLDDLKRKVAGIINDPTNYEV